MNRRGSAAPLVTLGCMNFGKRTSETESRRILERALERGVRTFDTANVYNDGASERILGEALRGQCDVFVATKVGLDGLFRGKAEGLGHTTVIGALERSLERLKMDRIALYYLHAPDHRTPFDETLDALTELHQAGRIERFGVSNFSSWSVLEMIHACDARKVPRPVASQVLYNAAVRQIELEHLAFCEKYAVHVTVYNPLAGGLLVGTVKRGETPTAGTRFATNRLYPRRYLTDRMLKFAEAFCHLAASEQRSMVDLAYGWIAAQSRVDSILIGPASVAHLDAALDALARPLPESTRTAIAQLQRDFDGTDATYAR